ncbi:odorant receptor 131-2-like [Clupea harengus]|uniref:Odorant receptor 131-2-like n=1 Tax=Clupea harengus TaxID=7950 RepID=A0A6P3WCV7_CLUHA|nr:odorant receptor 131-2-like [Clupea harengus]
MNDSSSSDDRLLKSNDRTRLNIMMSLVQLLVWPFISINLFMYFVFRHKRAFRTEPRYLLFAQTLLADSALFLMTDFVVITINVHQLLPIGFCIPFLIIMYTFNQVSPTVITAMCLERYVAICIPLRHVNIFSPNRTLIVIAIVWFLSFIKPFIDFLILLSAVSQGYFKRLNFCYYEIILLAKWHMMMRGNLYIMNYLAILVVLLFCYASIFRVARRASGKDKKAAARGQKTLLLHLLQLFLCTLEIICPYVEARVMEVDVEMYLILRYFNFLAFTVLSRAIIPLIYGFRDEKFYAAMKSYTLCKRNHVSTRKKNVTQCAK